MNWSEKSFLVVGGSSGMGLELVRRLNETGARVTVWSREKRPALDEISCEHVAFDARSEEVPEIPNELSGVAYLPGSITLAPFERIKSEQFREDYEINVLGAVRVLQQAVPAMAKNGGGSAVLVSTVAAKTGMPYHASIAAAKAAVEGLARSLAAEYAPKAVRVNAIAPSLTDTPMAERLVSSDEKRARSAERHPIKRIGTPDEMAAAILYLLSDEAGWVTGQTIGIDGGIGSLR
ncbi:MAG: SDR family NAD(P)-dependent oxidoreductase [Spirochaetales bacterium]